MTEHPAKGCTKRQIETFEAIAVGQAFGHHPKVIDGLLRKGLIEITEQTVGRDRFGSIIVRAAYVPLPIHAQWCEWCGENVSDDELQRV